MTEDKSFSGDDFQAKAAMNPDVKPVTGPVDDDDLKPSEQTDYRSVDEGMTSIGVTSQNSDTALLGPTDTPGVRTGSNDQTDVSDGRDIEGPDVQDINNRESDAIAGDNVDDKTGKDFINDPDDR